MGNKIIVKWMQFHLLTPENDDLNDISVKSSKKMFTWLPINPNELDKASSKHLDSPLKDCDKKTTPNSLEPELRFNSFSKIIILNQLNLIFQRHHLILSNPSSGLTVFQ